MNAYLTGSVLEATINSNNTEGLTILKGSEHSVSLSVVERARLLAAARICDCEGGFSKAA